MKRRRLKEGCELVVREGERQRASGSSPQEARHIYLGQYGYNSKSLTVDCNRSHDLDVLQYGEYCDAACCNKFK